MHSPVMSKVITFHKSQKNKDGTKKNVAAHVYYKIWYIGSRPGVDLTPLPADTLNSSPDELLETTGSAAELYEQCVKSSGDEVNGLWGNFDVSSLRSAARLGAHQIDSGKNVFDGLLSLREDDAVELGFDQKKNWYDLTKKAMPEVAKILNIPLESFTWCAALHMTPGHIHLHYEAWNSNQEIRKAFVTNAQKLQIREAFSNIIFEHERQVHIENETLQRDALISLTDELSKAATNLLLHPECTFVPKEFSRKELKDFTDKLLILSKFLPQKGKLQYGYLPFKIKQMMDQLIDSILTSQSLAPPYQQFLHAAAGKRMAASASTPEIKVSVLKATEYIHRRLSNCILTSCDQLINDREKLLQQWESRFPAAEHTSEAIDNPDDTIADDTSAMDSDILCFLPESDKEASVLWTPQYNKARKLLYNDSVPNKTDALSLLEKEAGTGNALALDALAKIYEQGIYVEGSPDVAKEYYQKAFSSFQSYIGNPIWKAILSAHLDDTDAYFHFRLGNYYEHGLGLDQNIDAAISHYEKAAGNPYADYALSNLYLHSNAGKQDILKKCALLYKRAADHGHGPAAYAYAQLAEKEPALNISPEQAEEYYKAAFSFYDNETSSPAAPDSYFYRLGTMYYSGKGVAADPERAYQFFQKAASADNPFAQYALGKTYADQTSPHYNPERAAVMFSKAANQGNGFAYLELGKLYLLSDSSLYDTSKAIEQFEAALDSQPVQANYQLGKLYCDKEAGCFNPGKAIHHLLAACQEGCNPAQYALGKLYLDESLTCFQFQTGLTLIRQSAAGGNPFARIKLGCLYLWGHGSDLASNEALGKYWLNRAMEQDNDMAKEFAQKTLNMYQNYRNRLALGLTCRLLLDAAQIISTQKRQLSDPYASIASKVKTRESIKDSKKKKDREK